MEVCDFEFYNCDVANIEKDEDNSPEDPDITDFVDTQEQSERLWTINCDTLTIEDNVIDGGAGVESNGLVLDTEFKRLLSKCDPVTKYMKLDIEFQATLQAANISHQTSKRKRQKSYEEDDDSTHDSSFQPLPEPVRVKHEIIDDAFPVSFADNTPRQRGTGSVGIVQRNHACHLCSKTFRSSSHLKDHLMTHTQEKPHECPHCGVAFRQKSHLTQHLKKNRCQQSFGTSQLEEDDDESQLNFSRDRKHACDQCSSVFKTRQALNEHSRIHTNERPFLCPDCGETFRQKCHVKAHMKSSRCAKNREVTYELLELYTAYQEKTGLTLNITEHDLAKREAREMCMICTVDLSTTLMLVNHVKRHVNAEDPSKPLPSEETAFETSTLSNSNLSNVSAADVDIMPGPPYVCMFCGKTFRMKSHMKDHIRVHTNERPFQCVFCKKGFKQKSQLNIHSKNCTGSVSTRGRKPKNVEKQAETVTTTENSEIINDALKDGPPYQCPLCSKILRSRGHYMDHVRVHTREKPFGCQGCGASFRQKSALRSHQKRCVAFKENGLVLDSTDPGSASMDVERESEEQDTKLPLLPKVKVELHDIRTTSGEFRDDTEHSFTKADNAADENDDDFEGSYEEFDGNYSSETEIDDLADSDYDAGSSRVKADTSRSQRRKTTKPKKLFTCSVCNKVFKGSGSLKAHMLIHMDALPFKCTFCDSRFRQHNILMRHIRSQHETVSKMRSRGHNSEVTTFKMSASRFIEEAMAKYGFDPKDVTFKYSLWNCEYCELNEGKLGKVQKENIEKVLSEMTVDGENWGCKMCDFTSIRRHMTMRHVVKHFTGPRKLASFVCEYCGSSFKTKQHLTDHVRIHTGERPFQCQFCPKRYITQTAVRTHETHMHGHNPKPYQCMYCPATFRKQAAFDRHTMRHITEPKEDKRYQCEQCGKEFKHKASYNLHMKYHLNLKPHVCNVCNSSFVTKSHLRDHMAKHTDDRPYTCSVCDQTFKLRTSLQAHKLMHREKQLECEICLKKFHRECDLSYHLMKHRGERNFTCELCGEKFIRRGDMNRHQALHADPNRVNCPICNKNFKTQAGLDDHAWVHENGSRYYCDQCDAVKPTKSRLDKHKYYNHRATPEAKRGKTYECNLCSKVFRSMASYKEHHRVKHAEEYGEMLMMEPERKGAPAKHNDSSSMDYEQSFSTVAAAAAAATSAAAAHSLPLPSGVTLEHPGHGAYEPSLHYDEGQSDQELRSSEMPPLEPHPMNPGDTTPPPMYRVPMGGFAAALASSSAAPLPPHPPPPPSHAPHPSHTPPLAHQGIHTVANSFPLQYPPSAAAASAAHGTSGGTTQQLMMNMLQSTFLADHVSQWSQKDYFGQ